MRYTQNIDAYDVHAILLSNIQMLYKLLQPLDLPPFQKVIVLEDAVFAMVCVLLIRVFARH